MKIINKKQKEEHVCLKIWQDSDKDLVLICFFIMISKNQLGLLNSTSDLLIFNFVLLLGSVCPLVFPNMTNILKECGNMINNQTACCKAMESYVSQLQQQSFLTNLQALNCAASLGMRLQEANVSYNVYNLCHINLKDFSLQGQLFSIPLK
jgi:hypothetical protein